MSKSQQRPFPIDRYVKLILIALIFCSVVTYSQGQTIKTPQPWTAQSGSTTFSLTTVDTFSTDLKFGGTFTVNLRVLQNVPQVYQIVLGFRKMDTLFTPLGGVGTITQITATTPLSTTFDLLFLIDDQRLLTQIKANYLLIGTQLITTMMVQSLFINIPAICDGYNGAKTCTQNITTTVPALTYKLYLSISGFSVESRSTSSATTSPSQTSTATKFESKVKSFTLTTIEIEFKIDQVRMNSIKIFAIMVHPTMFDQTVVKKTMFIELDEHLTSSTPFFQTFSEKVLSTNFFTGFYAFKGFKWSFEVTESNPNDFFLKASITAGSTVLDFFAFVMYGYKSICTGYKNCLSCYQAPNYDCTQCYEKFVLTPPYNTDNTCQCPNPLTIVSGVCDSHQLGCIVVVRLANSTLDCKECDFNKMLVLNPMSKLCQCKPYFSMDANFICQEICGDGVIVNAECDDANVFSGDGCSSSCTLEPGFDCNLAVAPTKCKSQSMLFYKIEKITKSPDSNSATLRLHLPLLGSYPFSLLSQHFDPISTYLQLRIIFSTNPYTQIIVNDLQIVDIGPSNKLQLSFSFNQSIEGASGKLVLNYEKTPYFNYTQALDFPFVGDNAALVYEGQIATYKTISYGMLGGTIVNSILLFVGFISPKFIGLESILTLQLIFFSQTLVYDHMKFPVGFIFLQTLQYSTGFNDVLDLTEYDSSSNKAKKMSYIKRHKTIIQNFNVNFIILLFSFLALLVVFILRCKMEKQQLAKKQQLKVGSPEKKDQNQEKLLIKKHKNNPEVSLRKINDIIFYVCNQIAFWLFLPLISSIAAEIIIENSNLILEQSELSGFLVQKAGEAIAIPSTFMIFMIIMSNFGNIWQCSESMSNAYERPEEIYYKRWLFVYLGIVGFLVLFANGLYYMKVYTSVIVLLFQIIHMIVIISINPYKMSLKVHTIGMLINNSIYLAFLVIINLINYLDKLQPNIAMFFGYAMIAFCVASIVVTIIRLYYELRYGRELEIQLQEERLQREKEEKLREQALLRSKMEKMENDAKNRVSEKQRMRQKNVYLHENQVQEDQKKELIAWLENRPADKKVKQAYYFQKFAEKPLEWLKINDPAKYELKINELNQQLHDSQLRVGEKMQDDKYHALTAKLRKEVKSIKKVQEERVRMHEKGLKTDPNYSMNMHKIHHEKMVQQAYMIKD